MSCDICLYAAEHGSWPPTHRGTHCECHRSWTGRREAHCMGTTREGIVCHQHFSADSVADRHRRGGYCMTREEMTVTRSKSGVLLFRECDTPKGKIWRGGETLKLRSAPEWMT